LTEEKDGAVREERKVVVKGFVGSSVLWCPRILSTTKKGSGEAWQGPCAQCWKKFGALSNIE